jgi:hypothetical protein
MTFALTNQGCHTHMALSFIVDSLNHLKRCVSYFFFAVLAAALKFFAVGAPFEPTLRGVPPLARFAWMFAYKPVFLGMIIPYDKLTGLMPRQKVLLFLWWTASFCTVSSLAFWHPNLLLKY